MRMMRRRSAAGAVSPRVQAWWTCPVPHPHAPLRTQMPCNETGLTDLSAPETNFGVIDFDWSNSKSLWVDAQPMNCEEMLMEQAKLTRAARPDAKVRAVLCGHPPAPATVAPPWVGRVPLAA
jgi:hypothetical protein